MKEIVGPIFTFCGWSNQPIAKRSIIARRLQKLFGQRSVFLLVEVIITLVFEDFLLQIDARKNVYMQHVFLIRMLNY